MTLRQKPGAEDLSRLQNQSWGWGRRRKAKHLPIHAPPSPGRGLPQRLQQLRLQAEQSASKAAFVSCIPGCCLAWPCLNFLGPFAGAGIVLPISFGSMSQGLNDKYQAIAIALEIVVSIVVLLTAIMGWWIIARLIATKLIAYYRRDTLVQLTRSGLMQLAVDEAYMHEIIARVDEIPMLKWIGPPPPKTLEQQLEFSACFKLALAKMQWGTARLDKSALWQGGFAWFTSQTACFACGCVAIVITSWLAIGGLIVGALFYCQRNGALAAYCDLLLASDVNEELLSSGYMHPQTRGTS